jgi:glycine/D-amino acid oxidase-like deaminating enzyme
VQLKKEKTMADAIVIGAGIFGQAITKELRRLGQEVTLIDANKPMSGSKPSAGLIKPSWFSGMRSIYNPAIEKLDELFGVVDLNFRVGPVTTKVHWVPPAKVLAGEFLEAEVVEVQPEVKQIVLADGEVLGAPTIVVAAGHWANQIIGMPPMPEIIPKTGVSFRWQGQLEQPFIRPWAPYKQILAFNHSEREIWVGDGSAIIPKNWTEERQQKSLNRCAGAVKLDPDKAGFVVGIRPAMKKVKPCYLEEPFDGFWLANGGAKSGMLGAGYAAHVIGSYNE